MNKMTPLILSLTLLLLLFLLPDSSFAIRTVVAKNQTSVLVQEGGQVSPSMGISNYFTKNSILPGHFPFQAISEIVIHSSSNVVAGLIDQESFASLILFHIIEI